MRVVTLSILFLVAAVGLHPAPAAQAADPIKFGFSAPLTSPIAFIAERAKLGTEYAVTRAERQGRHPRAQGRGPLRRHPARPQRGHQHRAALRPAGEDQRVLRRLHEQRHACHHRHPGPRQYPADHVHERHQDHALGLQARDQPQAELRPPHLRRPRLRGEGEEVPEASRHGARRRVRQGQCRRHRALSEEVRRRPGRRQGIVPPRREGVPAAPDQAGRARSPTPSSSRARSPTPRCW